MAAPARSLGRWCHRCCMRAPARLLVPIPAARLPRPAAPPLQVLCECLVYAACIQQRVAPADIADLADLLHRLSLRARGGGGGDLAAQQQAYVVLLAALLTLLPLENAEGADAEADEHALRSVAASPELDAKLGGSAADDPHGAVLKLAWGVLLSQYGPESAAGRGGGGWVPASWLGGCRTACRLPSSPCPAHRSPDPALPLPLVRPPADRAAQVVQASTDAGALGFLRAGVLDSVAMADEADHQRELYAGIINQLLMGYLGSPAGK